MQQIISSGAFTDQIRQIINQNFAQAGIALTGNPIFLDPANQFGAASDTNDGLSPGAAKLTLAGAYATGRSGYNDYILLMSNGATSASARVNAAFTWAKSCLHLIGIGAPVMFGQRARIANGTTATAFANFFTISGIGNLFSNVELFQGFATGTTAEIGLTITGARNAFVNCQIVGMADAAGAADAGSRHLKISSSENYFSHCVIGEDTVPRTNANSSIEFSGNVARNVFEDCILPAYGGAGGAPTFIMTAATAAMDRITYFRRCVFANAIGSGATAMTAGITLHASNGGYLLLDSPTFIGLTAIADSTSKSQVYLNGPTPNGGAGVSVVVT